LFLGVGAPLLADLFLYSYESEFLQKLVKDKKIHEARAFNFTYRYIDDVLSINNSRFAELLPLIYPPELEVKEIKDTASTASFLDIYREVDDSGQISTKIYDKRDDFNFKIINFPNMCGNIPVSPASTSQYMSKNDAVEAVSLISLTSSSGGYINGRNSANLELLIDKTSSTYLYVKLKALAS
jgi:hypothetical protein